MARDDATDEEMVQVVGKSRELRARTELCEELRVGRFARNRLSPKSHYGFRSTGENKPIHTFARWSCRAMARLHQPTQSMGMIVRKHSFALLAKVCQSGAQGGT